MKILIRHKEALYRFIDFQNERDGSVYLSVDRIVPSNSSRMVLSPHNEAGFVPAEPLAKPRKLSYHTTGRVNYHGLVSCSPRYFEPLVALTTYNHVLLISVPAADRLGPCDAAVQGDHEIELPPDTQERFTVGIAFAPVGATGEGLHGYLFDFPNFTLCLYFIGSVCEPPSPAHFVYAAPGTMFPHQLMGKPDAELAYIQGDGPNEITVRGPNSNGHYTMYFAVVMRAAPRVNVELADKRHRFEIISNNDPHKLTFRIQGRGDLIRETDLRPFIRRVELDAELPI